MNIPAPFSENQMRFFWGCFDHWFNVAEGGKRGGKNVLITMAYCTILEKHPSRIHLIDRGRIHCDGPAEHSGL